MQTMTLSSDWDIGTENVLSERHKANRKLTRTNTITLFEVVSKHWGSGDVWHNYLDLLNSTFIASYSDFLSFWLRCARMVLWCVSDRIRCRVRLTHLWGIPELIAIGDESSQRPELTRHAMLGDDWGKSGQIDLGIASCCERRDDGK